MVKNSGGNKSKKQARKTVGIPITTQNVRYIKEEGEMYAVITKIYGGKTCQVMCDDGVSRRCTIRRKFMMSRRGDNALSLGSWLMIGLYDWEKRADGSQTCDILEVYSIGEREKIKQTVNAKLLKHIMAVNNALDDNKNGSEFIFSDTLASIANEDEEEEEEEPVKPVPIISLKKLLEVKKESGSGVQVDGVQVDGVNVSGAKVDVKNQLDWMNISVDDI